MANNNTPAHDFAPAWLKIPTYDTYRTSVGDCERSSSTSRREDHRAIFNRRSRENDYTSRQNYFLEPRRERDTPPIGDRRSYFPSRHHSIDIDDSQYFLGSSRPFCFNNSHGTHLSSSQPSLLRRPHSKPERESIQLAYPKFGTAPHDSSSIGSYPSKIKVKQPGSAAPSNKSISEDKDPDVSSNNFNRDFPSLPCDVAVDNALINTALNGGVWVENPRNVKLHSNGKKIHLIQRPVKNEATFESRSKSPSVTSTSSGSSVSSQNSVAIGSPKLNPHAAIVNQANKSSSLSQASSSIYRALVPTKTTQNKKACKDGSKVSNKKLSDMSPPAHTMEILVKNPKTRGNKSEFLKALRSEVGGKSPESEGSIKDIEFKNSESDTADDSKAEDHSDLYKDERRVNGLEISKLSVADDDGSDGKQVLSSSLEAEQRLLREMGWKEECSDDDTYAPLTEDELREFRDLTRKITVKKNGVQRNLQLNWSPKRMPPFGTVVPPIDNWSSSSDTDTDSE